MDKIEEPFFIRLADVVVKVFCVIVLILFIFLITLPIRFYLFPDTIPAHLGKPLTCDEGYEKRPYEYLVPNIGWVKYVEGDSEGLVREARAADIHYKCVLINKKT